MTVAIGTRGGTTAGGGGGFVAVVRPGGDGIPAVVLSLCVYGNCGPPDDTAVLVSAACSVVVLSGRAVLLCAIKVPTGVGCSV